MSSAIPDRIKSLGGFKTSRDNRNKNVRLNCPWCPKEGLLFTSYGPHIIKEHLHEIFAPDTSVGKANRKCIKLRSALSSPITIEDPKGDGYWCMGCQSCFRCFTKATQHLDKKKCAEAHSENVLQLRDTYPYDADAPTKPALRFRANLEDLIDSLLYQVRYYEHKNKVTGEDVFNFAKYQKYNEQWELDIDEAKLKEQWPAFEEEKEEEVEETPESEEEAESTPLPTPEDDEVLPLVIPKPLSKEERLLQLLNDPDIDEGSKAMLRKQLNVSAPAPAPAPPPPPPSEPAFDFTKLSPWERIRRANPSMSVQELLMYAQSMGIRPDENSGMKIIGNTKRTAKQV